MAYGTILWATDLSKNSLQAVGHVRELAEAHNARVVALYVGVDLCSYFPAYGNYPSRDVLQEFHAWELEQARHKLEAVCSKELAACPNLSVRVLPGDPAGEILKAVTAEKADLVVMATRGQGSEASKAAGTGLGSVAAKVVAGSSVPVQFVNPNP
ncbi:UspA domain-containing protein [Solidesulfovibrio carbinoliphilus subsp. oakridgensis]|uniref:UspA domain-containing protein n=1 Tax=Solidesulfovibrio carbinoliphilus subsp. oakridgensis TaxID=694327 RepID=G7QDW7_9BACT|nr:universal stress protein [Solidesulfovibrio carbinoliphilus]EHJ46623.1 UspA domain-containing protein [Solidesulfovibrio carbinoliphilus subsp. oakridgensis]